MEIRHVSHVGPLLPLLPLLFSPACKSEPGGRTAPSATAERAAEQPGEPRDDGDDPPVGEWKRTLLTFDENANEVLDPEERKPEVAMNYGYTGIRFEKGGKCGLETKDKSLSGRCKIVPDQGKRWLAIYPDPKSSDELNARYLILSMSEQELAIKDATGSKGTIYVYARR